MRHSPGGWVELVQDAGTRRRGGEVVKEARGAEEAPFQLPRDLTRLTWPTAKTGKMLRSNRWEMILLWHL